MGLPYLLSPTWKKQVSRVASMKLPGAVDQEQAHCLALDLAAEDHAGVEVDAGGAQRRAVLAVDAAHGAAQHARGVEHALRVPDGDAVPRRPLSSFSTCRISRTLWLMLRLPAEQHDHEAVARLLVDHHLAEGADGVQARVGARVRQEHEAGVEADAHAVGHGWGVFPQVLRGGTARPAPRGARAYAGSSAVQRGLHRAAGRRGSGGRCRRARRTEVHLRPTCARCLRSPAPPAWRRACRTSEAGMPARRATCTP
jgi:hypothetical protein